MMPWIKNQQDVAPSQTDRPQNRDVARLLQNDHDLHRQNAEATDDKDRGNDHVDDHVLHVEQRQKFALASCQLSTS